MSDASCSVGWPGHFTWGLGTSIWQEGVEGVGAKNQIAFPCSDWKENYKMLKVCGLYLFPFFLFLEHVDLGFRVLLPKVKEVGVGGRIAGGVPGTAPERK